MQTPNVTNELGLNQWQAPDELNTTQFNEDNRLVDEAVAGIREDIQELEKKVDEGGSGGGTTIDIIDNLDSERTDAALSAHQGRVLKEMIDDIEVEFGNIDVPLPGYDGENLTVRFAAAIHGQFGGNPWAWIQSRIRNGNYNWLRVGDYIPFEFDGLTYHAEIAAKDIYRGGAIPHHIEFVTRELLPETTRFNPANFNNGTGVDTNPFLASELFLKLNSQQGQVPNATTANPAMMTADFRTTGIFHRLPQQLRDVIVPKIVRVPRRFLSGQLLTANNESDIKDIGRLWLPFETEIYGSVRNDGHEDALIQFPLFDTLERRIKFTNATTTAAWWWLASALGGSSTAFASVGANGLPGSYIASGTVGRVPLCFRVA
jgi:hypothetical protein